MNLFDERRPDIDRNENTVIHLSWYADGLNLGLWGRGFGFEVDGGWGL